MVQDKVPVAEAAARLGLSEHAVRKRIQRGTLPAEKDETGRWLILLDVEDVSETGEAAVQDGVEDGGLDPSKKQPNGSEIVAYQELITSLRSEVDFLRSELTARTEELRRKDHIIAGFIERLPELPATADDAPRARQDGLGAAQGPRPTADAPPSRLRAWWRRIWWLHDEDDR